VNSVYRAGCLAFWIPNGEYRRRRRGMMVLWCSSLLLEDPGRDAAPICIRTGSTRRRQAKINDSYNQRVWRFLLCPSQAEHIQWRDDPLWTRNDVPKCIQAVPWLGTLESYRCSLSRESATIREWQGPDTQGYRALPPHRVWSSSLRWICIGTAGPWISILIFGLTTDSSSSSTRKVSPPVTELKAVHLRLVLRLSAVEPPQTYFPVSTMMVNPIPVQDKLCRASIQAFIPIMPVLGSSFAQLTSSRDHAVRAIRSRWRYLQHQLGLGTGLSVAITSSRHFGTTFAYWSSSLTAS